MREITKDESALARRVWLGSNDVASLFSFRVGFIAGLDHAADRLAALEAENERLRAALTDMLSVFDRNLPENSIGRQLCDEARTVLSDPLTNQ